MNRTTRILTLFTFLAAAGLFASGCSVHASPYGASAPVATVATAPARVYHNGRYLHYRTDGYYYNSGSRWVVAPAVPVHVSRYHRPATRRDYAPSRTYYTSPRHVDRRTYHRSRTYNAPSHRPNTRAPSHRPNTRAPSRRPNTRAPSRRPNNTRAPSRGSSSPSRSAPQRRTYRY